jgi:hypothetical protein
MPERNTHPQPDRAVAVSPIAQAIAEFLDWLKRDGITLTRIPEEPWRPPVPIGERPEQLIARYLDIEVNHE